MQCFCSRLAITACNMMASSLNKGLWRKKEDELCVVRVERFQALVILLEVLTISELLATLKSTVYLVSLYIRKLYLFEGVICM